MLFNSYAFIFGFMPVVLAGYWLTGKIGGRAPVAWLSAASLFFYGYWNPPFLLLLLLSGTFNFFIGHQLGKTIHENRRKWIFAIGIGGNLALLGVFKYFGPTLNFLHNAGLHDIPAVSIVLPLGISFWTFTQIGYLVDRRDGLAADLKPLDYSLFVNFFPHLIAGPILHVREIGPQILDPATARLRADMFAPSLTLFAIGLAKKVLIADNLANIVDPGYLHPAGLDMVNGWNVILSYSMQLYFDFSGYSDMAIGLAGMLGFKFPINFDSPYKSRTVIEYWQRWHITLTRYLNLLLFNPMSLMMTRRRQARGLRVSSKALKDPKAFLSVLVLPVFYTFTLAGIWHGAGLQYILFGLIHAVYISVNHAWRVYGPQRPKHHVPPRKVVFASILATFLAVIFAQSFFRASSCTNALEVIGSALGMHGIMLPYRLHHFFGAHVPSFLTFGPGLKEDSLLILVEAMVIVWCLPNSQQILGRHAPVIGDVLESRYEWLRWRPHWIWAVFTGMLFVAVDHKSEPAYYLHLFPVLVFAKRRLGE